MKARQRVFRQPEYLRDHGMVDLVVPRSALRGQIMTLLRLR